MAKPATPAPKPHAEETEKFRAAIPKLLVIFDKLEKLKPNGKDISKGVKAMADTLKEIRINVFSDEDETSPEAASAASTEAPAPAPPVVPGSTEAV